MKKFSRSSVALSLVPIAVMIGVGTVAYAFLEGWSLPDALYATIITVTTVGYGDFTPHTLGGRLFAILGKAPVMQAQLHQLDHLGKWQGKLLFETNLPPLIDPLKPKDFIFIQKR